MIPGAPAPITGPSWPRSAYDHLPLASGKTVGETDTVELYRLISGVEGFSHTHGRERNLEAYAAHLAKIHESAGKAAVHDFVRSRGQQS